MHFSKLDNLSKNQKVGIMLTTFIVLIYIRFILSRSNSGKMAEWSKAQR